MKLKTADRSLGGVMTTTFRDYKKRVFAWQTLNMLSSGRAEPWPLDVDHSLCGLKEHFSIFKVKLYLVLIKSEMHGRCEMHRSRSQQTDTAAPSNLAILRKRKWPKMLSFKNMRYFLIKKKKSVMQQKA